MSPVVLVHGGYHGPWCWNAVAELMVQAGLPVRPVDLPFTTLADDIATVRREVEAAGADSVICAHSYGGLVMSLAASGISNLGHLVYVAAFMLDVRSARDAALLARVQRAQSGWEPWRSSFAEARLRLYHDCSVDDARVAFARLRPTPTTSFAELIAAACAPAYEQLPSTYVVCTQDKVIDRSHQTHMAERATYRCELDAGHAPFLSRPRDLATTLINVATTGQPA